MSQTTDCVVAGHICLDIAPVIPAAEADRIGDVLRPGKLLEVGQANISTGGTVSNTGLPLKRLGLDVKLMGKCGDDVFGRALIDAIRREAPGAEQGMRVVPGENTSYSVVLNVPGLDRMFLHCPGANDTFVADDVDLDSVRDAKLFHFGYPPLMADMYANDGAELLKLLAAVKHARTTTSLDMSLPDPAGTSGQANWTAILHHCLPSVDIFTPSVEELTFMLRRKAFDRLLDRAAGREMLEFIDGELLCDLGNRCIEAGAGIALIKCGRHGIYLRTAGRGRLERFGHCRPTDLDAWTNRELFAPSYRVDDFVSATGAGDCSIAGFLAAFLHACDPPDALRYACAVGAQNVQAADAISGVKTWPETQQQLAANPPTNELNIPLPRFRQDNPTAHYTGPNDGKA